MKRFTIVVSMVAVLLCLWFLRRPDEAKLPQRNSVAQRMPTSETKSISVPMSTPAAWERDRECERKLNERIVQSGFFETLRDKRSWDRSIGAWYFVKQGETVAFATEPTSTEGKFLLALAHANLLEGGNPLRVENLEESLRLLEEVSAADPGNSAPLVYAAVVARRLGADRLGRELLARVRRTNRFDLYMKTLTRAVLEDAKNPFEFVMAVEAAVTFRSPNLSPLTKLQNPALRQVALQMVGPGLDKKNILEVLEWNAVEHNVGLGILKRFDPTAESRVPRFNRLPGKLEFSPYIPGWACDLELLQPTIEAVKARLAAKPSHQNHL